MALLNFKKRFVEKILSGEKTHTIRAWRKYPVKAGETLHLYTGLRQKGARLLMRVPCVRVDEIKIHRHRDKCVFEVSIAGVLLDQQEKEALARRDGFADFTEMCAWWDDRLDFEGQIIYWR